MRLDGKTALVTGAGSGFGAAIAARFAQEGARVLVNDIEQDSAQRTAQAIVAARGTARAVQGDVTQAPDWQQLIDTARAEYGGIDIVVNNAGWTHRNKPFLEVTEAEFERVYAVNVKSIFLSGQYVLPLFVAQRGGCFVNIASTAGVRPRPGLTVYNSSKGAVIILSKSMAAEFGPYNVRVNCVNPVFSPDTALSSAFAGGTLTDEAKERFRASVPLGRLSTPTDVANATLFLASDEAAMVSGVCLEVDGGRCV